MKNMLLTLDLGSAMMGDKITYNDGNYILTTIDHKNIIRPSHVIKDPTFVVIRRVHNMQIVVNNYMLNEKTSNWTEYKEEENQNYGYQIINKLLDKIFYSRQLY